VGVRVPFPLRGLSHDSTGPFLLGGTGGGRTSLLSTSVTSRRPSRAFWSNSTTTSPRSFSARLALSKIYCAIIITSLDPARSDPSLESNLPFIAIRDHRRIALHPPAYYSRSQYSWHALLL